MKTFASALILSASFLGAAQAGELDWPPPLDTTSTLTRAEVLQQLAEARAAGEIPNGEQAYPATPRASETRLTRDQVLQELRAARAAGLIVNGEQAYPAHG